MSLVARRALFGAPIVLAVPIRPAEAVSDTARTYHVVSPRPDYPAMDTAEFYKTMGDDAAQWAAAFCQFADKLGHHGIDEGWMIGWFAAAIEHSSDVRRWRRKGIATAIWEPAP